MDFSLIASIHLFSHVTRIDEECKEVQRGKVRFYPGCPGKPLISTKATKNGRTNQGLNLVDPHAPQAGVSACKSVTFSTDNVQIKDNPGSQAPGSL
jgi:hypothetical protein